MDNKLTTTRTAPGEFSVYWQGAETKYQIINGSLGLSGRDTPNVYGIVNPVGTVKWVGTLSACKKTLALTLRNHDSITKGHHTNN